MGIRFSRKIAIYGAECNLTANNKINYKID